MPIVNLTNHVVRVADETGRIVHEFPSQGQLRLAVRKEKLARIDGIPVSRSTMTVPDDLPAEEGTIYIVSTPAASAIRDPRFVAPDTGYSAIRGADGQVFAVRGFLCF